MGPYTAQVLAEQRAAGNAPVSDRARQLYEQIGVLYGAADDADTSAAVFPHYPEPGEGPIAQQLAGFLDEVRLALATPAGPTARALGEALRRYERDRTGGRS